MTTEPEEGKPPFFRSWTSCYTVVLVVLTVLILLFYFFTRFYQ